VLPNFDGRCSLFHTLSIFGLGFWPASTVGANLDLVVPGHEFKINVFGSRASRGFKIF